MKTLITTLTLLIASAAFAAPPYKVGFRAYSTAASAPTQCAVWGTRQVLTRDDNGVAIPAFAPNPAHSRTFDLGTKGMANYSTNLVKYIRWTCRLKPLTAATASTAVRVKVFMDGVETHFLTASEGEFVISQ